MTILVEPRQTLVVVEGTTPQVLVQDRRPLLVVQQAAGTVRRLANLDDVDTTGVVDGGVLVYDDATSTWVDGDHGNIAGLADDDHPQYHTDARGDSRYYTRTLLDTGQLDSRYYTEVELDGGILDARYYTESEHVSSSAGAGDAGKPIILDVGGQVDGSMIDSGDVDHGSVDGLGDDDHTQYHNNTRGDARYYTQGQLDGGQLNSLYYTEAELDGGALDGRYYTQALLNAGQLDTRYYTEFELDGGALDGLYYTQTLLDGGQLDNRYFTESEHINISAGVADAGKPVVLDAAGLMSLTMIPVASISHANLANLVSPADDHTQYLLIDGTRAMTGNLEMDHIGISRAPTATHMIIAAEIFTTSPATIVGLGCFPEYRPGVYGANSLVSTQGNAWFATTNWGIGSSVRCLDFYPAPQFTVGGTKGSGNLDISGINTAGMLNIIGQTVVANTITGVAIAPLANLFGGTDNTTANIVRGILISAAAATIGTWGRLCGLEIGKQLSGVINQGVWLAGDGIGADLVLGAGLNATVYYDGTNLILDPDLVGSGRVLIGATGDDDMLLNTIEIDGNLNHDGAGVGFYGTSPIAKPTAIGAAGHAAVGGANVQANDTFTGGVGATAYTVGDIVAVLKNFGLITA